jgi:hypothetical protein
MSDWRKVERLIVDYFRSYGFELGHCNPVLELDPGSDDDVVEIPITELARLIADEVQQ